MKICPTCLDVHHDAEYARCQWCREGAPVEAALRGDELWFHKQLAAAVGGLIRDRLDQQRQAQGTIPGVKIERLPMSPHQAALVKTLHRNADRDETFIKNYLDPPKE